MTPPMSRGGDSVTTQAMLETVYTGEGTKSGRIAGMRRHRYALGALDVTCC